MINIFWLSRLGNDGCRERWSEGGKEAGQVGRESTCLSVVVKDEGEKG